MNRYMPLTAREHRNLQRTVKFLKRQYRPVSVHIDAGDITLDIPKAWFGI